MQRNIDEGPPVPNDEANLESRLAAVEDALGHRAGYDDALGERIAAIEVAIVTLNRDLGALDARLAAVDSALRDKGPVAWLKAVKAAWVKRRKPALTLPEEESVAANVGPRAVLGRPPLVPDVARTLGIEDDAAPRRSIIVTALGLQPDTLERVLDTIESYAAKRDVVPVVLTDHSRFEVFRRRDMAFEYQPPESSRQRFASDLDWDLYLKRRLALLRAKWQPVGVISFGSHDAPGMSSHVRQR